MLVKLYGIETIAVGTAGQALSLMTRRPCNASVAAWLNPEIGVQTASARCAVRALGELMGELIAIRPQILKQAPG